VTVANLPASVAGSCFGPNLEGLIAIMVGRYRLSRREALRFITDLTDLEVSLGTVVTICNRVSDSLAPAVNRIAETVRVSPVAYVDETGFKEGKRSGPRARGGVSGARSVLVTGWFRRDALVA
jgi:hypothetical protein